MAEDKIFEEAPKGNISSPFAMASKEGSKLLVNDQTVNVYAGTYGSDYISAPGGRNIYLPRGVSHGQQGGRDSIMGGTGRDTVILDGNQSDYIAVLPNIANYPRKMATDFWKDSPKMAHGRVVVLENTKTGDTYVMRDVEEVVFADNKLKFIQPKSSDEAVDGLSLTPANVRELDAAVASKEVVSVSAREILALAESGATPQEKLISRLTSTPQAVEAFEKMRGVRDYGAASKEIADNLMKGPNGAKLVEEIKAAPVSIREPIPEPAVQQPNAAPAPAIERAPGS